MSEQCPVTLTLISQASFHPFTDTDWGGFAGCEGKHPQITEINDCIVIVDEAENTTFIQVQEIKDECRVWGWEIPNQPELLV